ncbi:hypothetical protein JMJ58_22205 (plasmid) [Haloterrigena salifodinae]|uniref:PhiH1 repressor-like protein n=1 Tax=Haloterrigena salifodinae TaxID=2675099 RepID=A0A8T8E809_9EURY|nr:hypothetical protein [Haloterrigena salifodinae]QRV17546.1 hypothetical protein JMJ58_22205 [Haloterrigena salifodinae]
MTDPHANDGDEVPDENAPDANDGAEEAEAEGEAESEPDVPAEWMDPVDDEILELMRESYIFDPDHIETEDVCRAPHAAYRCRELSKRGLLVKQAIGMYDITELGEQYLEGEVDPTELEPEDE